MHLLDFLSFDEFGFSLELLLVELIVVVLETALDGSDVGEGRGFGVDVILLHDKQIIKLASYKMIWKRQNTNTNIIKINSIRMSQLIKIGKIQIQKNITIKQSQIFLRVESLQQGNQLIKQINMYRTTSRQSTVGIANIPFILIFILLISISKSLSDLSLVNCPSYYLKSTPQQSQNGFIQNGKSLYAAFQSQSHKDSLYKIIIQGDTDEFIDYAVQMFIPFVFVMLVFGVVMAFVIMWCLFARSCPPWQWTKRDVLVNPYTKKEMRFTFVWLLIFSVAILTISVLILSQIPNLKKNLQQTKCSLYVSLDTALNGHGADWAGFKAFRDNVGNISSLISSTTTQIGLYFTGDSWLLDQMTMMKTKNNIIYESNKDSRLVSANPAKTQTQLKAGFPAPLIDSLFIRRGLGPVGQNNTMTTYIEEALKVTQKLSESAHAIDGSARFLDNSALTIKNNFVLTQNILNMYIHQLQTNVDELAVIVDEYFTKYFSQFLYAVQIIIAIILVGTMLALIGSFSTAIFQILDCRKMVHLGWVVFGFSFVGGLILMYLFIGLGSVGYGFCQYYDGFLNGNDVFQTIRAQNSQNILNRIDACLYGDGDVIESFGVADQIKTLQNLFVNIDTYKDYTNATSANYVDTQFSINTINKWISAIQKYKLGIYIDSNPTQTNEDNPNYALSQMNLYSNTGGGVPTCSKDRWVFDRANCTDPGQLTYNTTDQTNGGALTMDKVLCISFNEGYARDVNGSFQPWTQEDFARRYVKIRQSCNIAYNNIIKFGNVLIDYRNSRINVFKGIEDSLNELLQQNSNFNEMLLNFNSRVTQFSDSTKIIKNLILSQTKGIRFASNCSVLGEKIRHTNIVFCQNFMSQVVRAGIFSIFLTILLLFGIWTGSLFAVRYAEIEKNEMMNPPEESEQDSERVISDKDKKSEDSD